MACLKSLRTDFLTGADTGGVWTYTGPSAIQVQITGISGTVQLQPGDTVGSTDNPELDFDTLAGLACDNTYPNLFTYTVTSGGCTDTATVGLTIACPPDAGTDIEIDLCESDSAVNLYDLLGATSNDGVWTGDTANPGYSDNGTGGDPTDDTFDPSASGTGTFSFTYTVSDTSTDCPCPDSVGVITINVDTTPEAGTGSTAEICI